MRYIGNKEKILDVIYSLLIKHNVYGETFFDFFAGTTNVGRFFKEKGYQVTSSDFLYLSYCLQKAYIENNTEPKFSKLLKQIKEESHKHNKQLFYSPLGVVVDYLNALPLTDGFIYNTYTPTGTKDLLMPRKYFNDDNGKKIDSIRIQIENWKKSKVINQTEYYVLLACLIETVGFYSNIAGVYAAFHKDWDPRALKPFKLRTIDFIDNGKKNVVYNSDSMKILKKINTDILYIDPPYNERQYAPNYHVLETIAKYDNPQVHGVTGMRDYSLQKSSFCNVNSALEDLDKIANNTQYKFLVLSYNSEGIMPSEQIIKILGKHGDIALEQFEYARYKSNNNGLSKTKKLVYEQLYILRKKT